MPNTEISRAYNFLLDIQGMQAGYFTEVSGLSVDIEVINYRAGGEAPAERKLPGRVCYGPVICNWGLTQNTDLWDWLMQIAAGETVRKQVSIMLLKQNGQDEDMRWNLRDAWVSSWRGARLNALEHKAAIETLTLVHEGLERG